MFRRTHVLTLMVILLFVFSVSAAEDGGTSPKGDDKPAVEQTDKKEKKDEAKESADKKKEEKSAEQSEKKADETQKEAPAEKKESVAPEKKQTNASSSEMTEPAESKPIETEEAAKPAAEPEVKAEAESAETTAAKPEKAPKSEASVNVVAKPVVSETDQKTEKSDHDGKDGAAGEKKDSGKGKNFVVFVNNGFANTQDFERPVFRYSLIGGIRIRLPWKIGFGFTAGFYASVDYNRPSSNSKSSGRNGYNVLLNRNLTHSKFDGIPLRFAFNRPFQLPWKLTLTPTVAATWSISSKFLWDMEMYSKLFLGLNLSRAFKASKNVAFNTALGFIYNVTFNGEEWIGRGTTAAVKIGLNPQSLAYHATAGVSYKSFGFNINWAQAFIYLRNGSWEDGDSLFPENTESERSKWNTINSLEFALSYSIKSFSFGLSALTEGPWSLYHNNPSWYPFRPDMTTYSLAVGYNYAF